MRPERLEMLEKLKYSIYPLARYAVSSSSDLYPAPEGLPSPEMIGNSVFMLPQSRAHLSRTCHSCLPPAGILSCGLGEGEIELFSIICLPNR